MRSAAQADAPSLAAGSERSRLSATAVLWGTLVIAFVLRLLFLGADGFKNDVSTFESWSLTLAEHPTREFFSKAGFADYPPGYFFILWAIGHVYKALVHNDPGFTLLKILVKLPATIMDLVDAALIFAIVRRYASAAWAYVAAAFFVLNPATIFISAYWGQVDSVAAGFVLAALYLMMRSDDLLPRGATFAIAGAWALLAYSILIKPPAVILVFLFLAFVAAARTPAQRMARVGGTAIGIGASLVMAYLSALTFHAGLNPVAQFFWLYQRYAYAKDVYPFNSVNAFNLYSVIYRFWQPDSTTIVFLPQSMWGMLILAAAALIVIPRFVQRRDMTAFLEAAMLLSLGYFVLLTRMHERYIFNAFLLAMPLMAVGRRYVFSAVALSITLLANLAYSLSYLHVMDTHPPNVDAADLLPILSRPLSLLNVLVFFGLTYAFVNGAEPIKTFDLRAWLGQLRTSARAWFAPLEGTARMLPVDWRIALGLTLGSFVLSFAWYWYPNEKIFDEIYYARAGEEYLGHKEIFEFTHPPLTKLIISLSMILFGGLAHGDTPWGWRFLNLVVGALMVLVLYLFAKRLLGSTLFAAAAAGMLMLDGFHFVQSRIATPEITVALFILLTLYAFYRLWIASQVRVAPLLTAALARRELILFGLATLGAAVFVWLAVPQLAKVPAVRGLRFDGLTSVVVFVYLELGAYLAIRLFAPRATKSVPEISYADGSRVVAGKLEDALPWRGEDGFRIEYGSAGEMTYATAEGTARFSPDGFMEAGPARVDGRRDAMIWLGVLALSGAALAASKWNGLFDFFVVWGLAALIVLQPWRSRLFAALDVKVARKPATWGNPLGISFDVLVAAMLFVGATMYVLSYIPYFGLGHSLSDMIGMQHGMYAYHHDLTASNPDSLKHPYASQWWQWPLIGRPISYYYHDFRPALAANDHAACCIAEIIALPNPIVWWLGLASVPFMAVLAWNERNKGYMLLVVAYLLQWLPWVNSPRVMFEYHFFPNLAIICLANAVLLQRVWRLANDPTRQLGAVRYAVAGYLALVVVSFAFFYPVVAGIHIPWQDWDARIHMFPFMNNSWV